MYLKKYQVYTDFSQRSSVANVEIEDSIASDELMYMDELEQARAIEQAALAEIELEMTTYPEPDADVPEEEATEATSRTLLKRELRAQALLRLEDGARTEDDTVWLSLDQMALGTLEKITDLLKEVLRWKSPVHTPNHLWYLYFQYSISQFCLPHLKPHSQLALLFQHILSNFPCIFLQIVIFTFIRKIQIIFKLL